MKFIETSIFTKKIAQLLSDDNYRLLQLELLMNPESGVLIKNSGGLRKIRSSNNRSSTRGGILLDKIKEKDEVYMLFAFRKNEMDNMSTTQLKALKKLVEEHLK
jgi:hypothetical protein